MSTPENEREAKKAILRLAILHGDKEAVTAFWEEVGALEYSAEKVAKAHWGVRNGLHRTCLHAIKVPASLQPFLKKEVESRQADLLATEPLRRASRPTRT